MNESKKKIRKEMLELRKNLNKAQVEMKSNKIIEFLLHTEDLIKSKVIMTYLSYPNEVVTDEFILNALHQDKTIAVPICVKETIDLIPSRINNLKEVDTGFFGLREPKKENVRRIDIDVIDVIIVPGVAFDKRGNRIGHGKGYYDHFLNKTPSHTKKIALAFDYQVVDLDWKLDDWDVKMDGIITEKGWAYKDF